MKKKITFLLFLAIGSVMLMASYRNEKNVYVLRTEYLTSHPWKFKAAESKNTESAFVISTIYDNSSYTFDKSNTYEGTFFEKPVSGTWELGVGNKLILDKGTGKEEIFEISDLTMESLRIRGMQKGDPIVMIYE